MKILGLTLISAFLLASVGASERNDIQKREPKNVADLDKLFQAYQEDHSTSNKVKRKNVANLENLEALLKAEQEEAGNTKKRDSASPEAFFREKSKRSQNVITAYQGPLVQSVLTQVRDVSVFAGYLRDTEDILKKLERTKFAVIIAPSDHALASKLDGHKPWEFPRDPSDEKDAALNIHDFVRAHIVKFEGDFSEIQDEVALVLFDGQKVVIRHDPATDSFKVERDNGWVDVVAVYYAKDGAVLVIDDTFVKPN